jgi:hypothetical protein
MPLYVTLGEMTDDGLRNIKEWPADALERTRTFRRE